MLTGGSEMGSGGKEVLKGEGLKKGAWIITS